jgi:hypothetical protein
MIAMPNKRRRGIFVSVSIATALLAASSTHAFARGERDGGDPTQTQAFIAETRVVAPLRVGEFVLEGNRRYDEHGKFGGVSFRYQHPNYPQVRFDLFVYPVGQVDPEQALKTGMRDFVASMQPAIDAGLYRNFVEGETVEFDLDLPLHGGAAAQGTPTAGTTEKTDENDDQTPDEAKREALLKKMLMEGKHIDGQRMSLTFDHRGPVPDESLPMRSRTYLFYRHLHYFKGRISASSAQIDEAAFAELTDRAMRELVPAVQAYNIGACGHTTIYFNTNASKEDAANQLMQDMLEASVRSETSNCHARADEAELSKLAEGASMETFTYSATDWNGK